MDQQLSLHKHDRIITADGIELGQTITLYQRREGIDPKLEPYAAYLEVFDFASGSDYYIPLGFLDTASDTLGAAQLSLTFDEVQNATFNRMPVFVAWHEGDELPLAS